MNQSSIRRAKGFTLLEVMVVIVILGILASMVVPNLMENQEQAAKQKVVTDIIQLENALDMYKLRAHRYPSTEQGIEALVEAPTIDPVPRNYPEDGFVKRLPKDPWGNEYQLLSPGEYGKVDVFSLGPDGEPGTDDDIGNWNLDELQN